MTTLDQFSATTLACLEEMIARRLLDDHSMPPDDAARRGSALYELSKFRGAATNIRPSRERPRPAKVIARKLRLARPRRSAKRPPIVESETSRTTKAAR